MQDFASILSSNARSFHSRHPHFGRHFWPSSVRTSPDHYTPPKSSKMTIHPRSFDLLNLPANFELPTCMEYFTMNAPPNSHIWRKPGSRDTTTAPIIYTSLRYPFVVAEVTVTASWEMEWDQAGLIIFTGLPPGQEPPPAALPHRHRGRGRLLHSSRGEPPSIQSCWVKAGLEFTGGTLNASSTVAMTPCGADWSLSPLRPTPSLPFEALPPSTCSLRIKFERVGDSLWVWYRPIGMGFASESASPSSPTSPATAGAAWQKMREVMGFFTGVEDKGGVWVGCYASRPMNFFPSRSWEGVSGGDDGRNGLVVEFEDLEVF